MMTMMASIALTAALLTPSPNSIRWSAESVISRTRSGAAISMVTRHWRLFGVNVPVLSDPEEAQRLLHDAVADRLSVEPSRLESVALVRRSLDARQQRAAGRRGKPTGKHEALWSHVVDVRLSAADAKRVKAKEGRCVPADAERLAAVAAAPPVLSSAAAGTRHVVVIGAGPCGLFAALALARAGVRVTLCERGKPVEERGKSIGALIKRGVVDPDSNFCYGEGGAGTWSDGKLTTRIGRNSAEVRDVLETLVHFGAPRRILIDGAPHLGTDNLVRLLKAFRAELISLGATIKWNARVASLVLAEGGGAVEGVTLAAGEGEDAGETILADGVVLAAGHSARELYVELIRCGATLQPKDFAAGFRIEHPQSVINRARYGELAEHAAPVRWNEEQDAWPSLPPAAYRLAANIEIPPTPIAASEAQTTPTADPTATADSTAGGRGSSKTRGVYSFCMCPGGQIVPTSLDAEHLCVNGMSYSNRGSKWANSAVVVSVGEAYGDYSALAAAEGGLADGLPPQLAGLEWQEAMEARAAAMGGGGLRCPAQRVSDFLAGRLSTDLPASSYRLGVTSAPLHELYPPALTAALREGITKFGNSLNGFDEEEGVLHGVETRTSAPVQVVRDASTCEAMGLRNLYPAGEGAGYAGGIISAAVDGLRVGRRLLVQLGLVEAKAEAEAPTGRVKESY